MRRFLPFLLLFVSVVVHADIYTQKLYEKVLGSVFSHRPIVAYVIGDAKRVLLHSRLFRIVSVCNEHVDVVIADDLESIPSQCLYRPIFATSHKAYKNSDMAFGAFYWLKGRPQLHFRSDKMAELGLPLAKDLQRYVDE